MDKTARCELKRTFLIEHLPEPLTRASKHIQIFDNYIAKTRMRLRSIRNPVSREWTHILQQRTRVDGETPRTDICELFLDTAEHERFEILKGNEIRKNRYFHAIDGCEIAFDVYLGALWGLNTAGIKFDGAADLTTYKPPFEVVEITNDSFFVGENLVNHTFTDVQNEVARLCASAPAFLRSSAE